ncbi:MAG: UbiA family prenyltransferase [Flavitalea sp.]
MFQKSTLQLLRFHFSVFLLPVFLFALSEAERIDPLRAILVFIILHLLVYPASNGYNSYMDRDTSPIGGVENPLMPTKELFYVTIFLDLIALVLSLFIGWLFALGILTYILASKAYSYRAIRLKKYPVIGYLTVVLFQGALTYYLAYTGIQENVSNVSIEAMVASSLLIGGFYPLTQIYQHDADLKDGVRTISYSLGYKGTFIFSALVYSLALGILFVYFKRKDELVNFFLLVSVMLPVLVYFFYWASKVWNDRSAANFYYTMRMNTIASVCTNLAFLIILSRRLF